ncbi:hypothetical protein [Rathayibacter sp. AY1B8]|uniref:hypothetical protein n=1 Tax=Rathayibacter sp. AY1B8 TaxID=2080533 RepID=UPI0011B03925|nr:hypothetical protein [Rathayibacter sp. AY1B8]
MLAGERVKSGAVIRTLLKQAAHPVEEGDGGGLEVELGKDMGVVLVVVPVVLAGPLRALELAFRNGSGCERREGDGIVLRGGRAGRGSCGVPLSGRLGGVARGGGGHRFSG